MVTKDFPNYEGLNAAAVDGGSQVLNKIKCLKDAIV